MKKMYVFYFRIAMLFSINHVNAVCIIVIGEVYPWVKEAPLIFGGTLNLYLISLNGPYKIILLEELSNHAQSRGGN